jgi:hypothetical protein
MEPPADQLRLAKDILLSSPPGQFDVLLEDLKDLISLPQSWIDEMRREFHSLTRGKKSLLEINHKSMIFESQSESSHDDPLELKEAMRQYMDTHYSGKGVESEYIMESCPGQGQGQGREKEYNYCILLYAERIKLQQFHAGSWTAKYSITANTQNNNDVVYMNGKVALHAHAFENGNVHVKSMVDFPTVSIRREEIIPKIQEWDESLVESLRIMYEDMSGDILKQFRRIMPVTRTRFDWNLHGHRGIRLLGSEVQKEKAR